MWPVILKLTGGPMGKWLQGKVLAVHLRSRMMARMARPGIRCSRSAELDQRPGQVVFRVSGLEVDLPAR